MSIYVDTDFILPSNTGPDNSVIDPFAFARASMNLRAVLAGLGAPYQDPLPVESGGGDPGSNPGVPVNPGPPLPPICEYAYPTCDSNSHPVFISPVNSVSCGQFQCEPNQPTPTQCPVGYMMVAGVCVPIPNVSNQCPEGYVMVNGICTPISPQPSICPMGSNLVNGVCTALPPQVTGCPNGCPPGSVQDPFSCNCFPAAGVGGGPNETAVYPDASGHCAPGYILDGGMCYPVPSGANICPPPYVTDPFGVCRQACPAGEQFNSQGYCVGSSTIGVPGYPGYPTANPYYPVGFNGQSGQIYDPISQQYITFSQLAVLAQEFPQEYGSMYQQYASTYGAAGTFASTYGTYSAPYVNTPTQTAPSGPPSWLSQQTLINGIPNGITAVGGLALLFVASKMVGKGR